MLKLFYAMSELDTEQLLAVYKENLRNELEFLSYLREDFFCQPDAVYAVWTDDSNYKSAVRLERYRDGLLLHALETVPEERRKGFAYALLSELLVHLSAANYNFVYSHVEKRNRLSLMLHKKCGFSIILDSATYLDGTVTQNSYTLKICL